MEQEEADDRRKIFDIALLADRLRAAAEWLARDPETQSLRLGYFGASTGAAAALVAAARPPEAVGAVVSRGGRPDLAWDDLPAVEASTLLIVGGRDEVGPRVEPAGPGAVALPQGAGSDPRRHRCRNQRRRNGCPRTGGAGGGRPPGRPMVPAAFGGGQRPGATERGDRFPRANRDLEC